ncbi:MAG: type II toxin-antitoxin system antitoxin SocA domain-containing protein [Candidatus Aenigmatarchaeota archaeon]
MSLFNRNLDSEEKLLGLIGNCIQNGNVNGRKKLMKLVFFMEYLDFEENRLSTDTGWGDFDFIIYSYGPFSHDVMDDFDELKEKEWIEEKRDFMGYSIELTEDGRKKLDSLEDKLEEDEIERLDKLCDRFSNKNGGSLERKSLEYLGITKEEKSDFMGTPVEVIISEEPA